MLRQLGVKLFAPFRPPIVNCYRAALEPADLLQPLHESGDPIARGRASALAQKTDGRQLPRLLCAGRERPAGSSADQSDKIASSHPF